MKIIISFAFVVICIAGALFASQTGTEKQACIEDWYGDASTLFSSASLFFNKIELSLESKDEHQEVDNKLQDLLPSNEIDLSYHSDEQGITMSSLSSAQDNSLLPNLFSETVSSPSTQFKGQVHTDEDDNIVGAEVNVSIPTDIR